ncbi:hypothetical protein ACFL29_00460 [Patescibacteria group bacterium]
MYTFLYKKPEEGGHISKFVVLLIFLGVVAFLGGVITLFPHAKTALTKVIELSPPKAKLIVIVPDDCDECFDVYQVTNFIKEISGAKYTKTKEYKASEKNADFLIKAYDIKVLPTFILQGKTEQLKLDLLLDPQNIGKLDEKVFVYKNYFPPYYSLEENKVRGQFELTYLADETCTKCYDVYLHDMALKNLIMTPSASSTVETYSTEGKELTKKYNLKHTPTILLRGDLDAYQNFKTLWQGVGTIEDDGTYIFREDGLKLMGPYKNIQTWGLRNLE